MNNKCLSLSAEKAAKSAWLLNKKTRAHPPHFEALWVYVFIIFKKNIIALHDGTFFDFQDQVFEHAFKHKCIIKQVNYVSIHDTYFGMQLIKCVSFTLKISMFA